ncbi:hypothetical protein BGZ89_007817 [Linnemannia elongata]|nr:hypothetical protein BGZ89_007817 [Linnemannia elongata]
MTLSIASLRHPSIQFCSTDNITGTLKKSTAVLYALEEAAHQKSFDMNLRNEEEETDISHHLAGKPLDRVPSAVGRTLGAAIGRMIDTAVEKDLRLDMKIDNTSVKQLDQESDDRDSRRRTSCEVTYHKGLKDGRRNSRDGPRYHAVRKDIHASSSRDDVGIDIRRDSRDDKRTNLRNDDRAPSRPRGYRGSPCYDDLDDARHGSREDYRYNSSTNASFDDPEEGRHGGVAGLFSRSRETSRREHPLEPLESRRKSYSQDRRSSSRQDDARVPRRSSRQDDLEDQWRSDGQKGRKEERRESREIYLPKETNSSAFPPKPHHNKAKTPRSSLQKHGANGMDEDDVPPTSEGSYLADAQDRIADSGDEKSEESLLSLLKRRRRLSQRTPISPTASEPPKTTSAMAPSSSSTAVVATTPTTSTSISTANPASGENVVCVSTKDSCPAYSFTLGRYKASEFVIHSAQHKDGPFTNKYRPLPGFCRNIIDVLEVWRYGTKTFTAVQDLTEKFGRSWIAPKDRERYQFFTEAVQEFKRLVMEEAMDDDQAVEELMGQQDWRLIPVSKPQTDEEAELSPEKEPMDTDSDSDFVSQPRCRSNKSQSGKKSQSRRRSQSLKRPESSKTSELRKRSESRKRSVSRKRSESCKRSEWSKKSPAISTDMDMDMDLDMDMDIGSTTANRTVAEEHSTSSDTEPMDHEMYSVSVTRPVSRSSRRNPRPQYKDNVVEPWGEVPVNRNFTFPIPDGIETVPDLYKAWHEGWGDIPSLFQLTKENGPSWTSKNLPSSKKIYDWYYAHYRVIRAVNDLVAKDKDWTVEKAIFALERLRGKKKLANLHKEIPRPGHMILPTEDKDNDNETPKMQSNSGSPAATDDINITSSNKVAPTTRPGDLNSTAGGSTANSSRTGSSETVTSDHTATTSTATIVPSSSTSSINGQSKSSTDGCTTPAAVASAPITKDKSTTSIKANSISNDNNILNAKDKTTSNNNIARRKSTTDSISTSSIRDKLTANVTTSAFNNTDNSHPNLTDDPINASITTTSGLMNEINCVPVPVAKDTTTGSFEPSSPVDNTAVSRPKSATSGNITPSIKDEILGSPKSGPVDNTTAERPQSTVHRISTPGAIEKSTTSISTANRITLAADSTSSLVDQDRAPDISMAKVINDASVSKSKAATESSILLSTKGRITTLHTPAVNGAVSKATLSTDRNGAPITKDRPSGTAAPSTTLNNTAVSLSNFITYTHNSVKSNQRATTSSQISSWSSKEQPPEGLTQNGSGVDRPNGMTASLNNDVTAGIENRLKTASANDDAKNVPNGMNTGIVQPPYSTNTYSLERPRSGSGYTVAPHGYVPRPKEQAETLHRRSRSGTEVTEILESGQVNSTHHAQPPHGAILLREAVPLPPSLQTLDQYPSSSSSMPQVKDERSVYYGPECYDDEDEQLVHKRPARQRPAPPPSPVPPAQQPQQHSHHNRRLQHPHYPQGSQQPLRPTQHYQHYQRQLQRLHQEEQQKQYHQQQQQWNRSLDHTRNRPPPSQHPSFSSSSSSSSSSHHYDHNWSARHWKSSTYDEVIDLT